VDSRANDSEYGLVLTAASLDLPANVLLLDIRRRDPLLKLELQTMGSHSFLMLLLVARIGR
jgi:hypothetical protein